MLIDAGASVTVKNNDGNLPTHCAAMAGCWGSISSLIDAGADPMAVGRCL